MDNSNPLNSVFSSPSRRTILKAALVLPALSLLPATPTVLAAGDPKKTAAGGGEVPDMTRKLMQFVVNTKNDDIPAEYYEHVKVIILDTIGVALAGRNEPLVQKLMTYTDAQGGNKQCNVWGYDVKKSASQAALINGSTCHALDFDDSSVLFWGHPSASMLPSLFVLGELEKANGRDLMASYLLGLKVAYVVSDSVGEEMYKGGFHCTSSLGIIASAASCTRLLGLNEEQSLNAFATATTQAFGLKRSFGTMCKPFHAGRAAEGAVVAALLGRDGFTGAHDILEGPNGLFQAFGGQADSYSMGTLGRTWAVDTVVQKFYAACQWTHSPIAGSLEIKEKYGVKAKDIKSIDVITSEIAKTSAGLVIPKSGLEGKFSIPYCVANALVTGEYGLKGYTDEAVKNPKVLELLKKTSVVSHPKAEKTQARVTITTKDGKKYVKDFDVFASYPTLEEKKAPATEKFFDNAAPVVGEKKAKQIKKMVDGFEKVKDVTELTDLLRA